MSKAALVVLIITASVAFFAGWNLKTADEAAPRTVSEDRDSTVVRLDYERLFEELETARGRIESLELEARARESAAADAPVKAGESEAGSEATERWKGPRFEFVETGDILQKLDWEAMGKSGLEIPPLLAELVRSAREDGKLMENVGDIQRWNGPLLTEALKLQDSKIPGESVNGKFSHPSVFANMIYFALAQSDEPLTEKQEEELQSVALGFMRDDVARLAGYGEATLELRKLIEDLDLKDKFFANVDNMLSTKQRAILHPESGREFTVGDLYSTGIVWQTVVASVSATDRQQLEGMLVQRVMTQLGLPADLKTTMESHVRKWSEGHSDKFLAETTSPLAQQLNIHRVDRVRQCARSQLAFMEGLLADPALPETAKAGLRSAKRVLVPYRTPAPTPPPVDDDN